MSMYGDLMDEDTGTLYEDSTTRCRHGTYIGTSGGPDFMCGRCESGDDDEREECAVCGESVLNLAEHDMHEHAYPSRLTAGRDVGDDA